MQMFNETMAEPLQKCQPGEISATPSNEDTINLQDTL